MSTQFQIEINAQDTHAGMQTFRSFRTSDSSQFMAKQVMLSLANVVCDLAPQYLLRTPALEGEVVFLSGASGRGKTHLLNAFANHIKCKAPELENSIGALNGIFTDAYLDRINPFGEARIIIVDDYMVRNRKQPEFTTTDFFTLAFLRFLAAVRNEGITAVVATKTPILQAAKLWVTSHLKMAIPNIASAEAVLRSSIELAL